MRKVISGICIGLMMAGSAFATVGGGDVVIKYKKGEAYFSHDLHVNGAGVECNSCHDKLFVSKGQHKAKAMKDMQKGASCGACHNGKTAFSVKGGCQKCHKKQ